MTDVQDKKDRLEAMLTDIIKELKTLGVQDPHNESDWVTAQTTETNEPDPNDVADRVEDFNERRATLATLETRFNNIRLALTKIENGTYGVCEISGEPIEAARLEANPAARTCTNHLDQEASLT